MDSPPPPDPYIALGLSKDATSETIKKAYRKLALRLHPDKCTDESLKAVNTEEFHKVQQAYDLVGDEDKRAKYDALTRLAELRRQNMELRNESPRVDVRTAAYDVRTAAPREASFTTRGPARAGMYDDRRPRYYEYEEAPRASSRKASEYEYANVKRSSPPRDRERERERERERVRASERESDERRRVERRREADVRSTRTSKYDSLDDYEEDRRRRDREYEDAERRRAEAKRPPIRREEVYSSYSSANTTERNAERTTERKMADMVREAQRHQERRTAEVRPTGSRTTSTREVPQYESPHRSSAVPRERTRRTSPVTEYERRTPNLSTHASSPPVMDPVRETPHRSYTTQTDVDPRRKKEMDSSPPPSFSRSTTMPMPAAAAPSATSRRKESTSQIPSRLRHSESAVPTEATYASPTTDGYASTKKTYRYPDDAAMPLRADSGNTAPFRTVIVEPSSGSRRGSISPVREARPASNTAAKMANLDPKRYPSTSTSSRAYAYPDAASARPSLSHTASTRAVPVIPRSSRSPERSVRRDRDRYAEDRASRSAKFYGEKGPGYPRAQPSSYRQDQVNFSKRFDENDVVYSKNPRGSRERDMSDFTRPSMQRSTTYAY